MVLSNPFITWIWRINVINQRFRNYLVLFLTSFTLSEYNKAAGNAMTEVYEQRPEHLQIYTYLNRAIEFKIWPINKYKWIYNFTDSSALWERKRK